VAGYVPGSPKNIIVSLFARGHGAIPDIVVAAVFYHILSGAQPVGDLSDKALFEHQRQPKGGPRGRSGRCHRGGRLQPETLSEHL